MTSTYLYLSSAVENSMHAHIYLIKKISNFQISDFFHIKLKNQKNIKFDKKKTSKIIKNNTH